MADTALLVGSALAVLGWERSKNNIYRVLTWAGNSGSIDVATGQNSHGDAQIGNVDPNFCGMGAINAQNTSRPPLPPTEMARPLDPVAPSHPGDASGMITNFGSSSLIGY